MRVAIIAPAKSRESLTALLACLFSLDQLYLRTTRGIPPLYQAGVRYQREDLDAQMGMEFWLTIPEIMAQGWGDCEDLAAWRAAELRVSGEDQDARPELVAIRPGQWHVIVRRGDGAPEDPSAMLGMTGEM
jgi:hypothetical protein